MLISDCITRWNSLFEACQRFIERRAALEIYWTKFCKEFKLTEQEWTLLEELCETLGPLYAATLELSAEKHTSISKIVPLTNRLKSIYQGKKQFLKLKFR